MRMYFVVRITDGYIHQRGSLGKKGRGYETLTAAKQVCTNLNNKYAEYRRIGGRYDGHPLWKVMYSDFELKDIEE